MLNEETNMSHFMCFVYIGPEKIPTQICLPKFKTQEAQDLLEK